MRVLSSLEWVHFFAVLTSLSPQTCFVHFCFSNMLPTVYTFKGWWWLSSQGVKFLFPFSCSSAHQRVPGLLHTSGHGAGIYFVTVTQEIGNWRLKVNLRVRKELVILLAAVAVRDTHRNSKQNYRSPQRKINTWAEQPHLPLMGKQWNIYCTKGLYALKTCKHFYHNTLFLIEYNMPLCRWNNEHVPKINVLVLDAESLGLHFCAHSTPEAYHAYLHEHTLFCLP